jgi:parallel beta-helix repeat protein
MTKARKRAVGAVSKRQAVEPLEARLLFTTYTVNASGGGANYTDLETAIVDAPAGSTLLVSPGTYAAHATTIDPTQSVFWINKSLSIESTAGPASTILTVPAGNAENILISASNVHIQGLSLQGGEFCADVDDFQNNTNLSDVSLKDMDLTPDATHGNGHGILFESVSNSVIEGCTVGLSYANGIFLDQDSDNDIVMDNTVTGTVTQHALAVKNSTNDQILDNTVISSDFDGCILFTASDCRVTGNNISGQLVDGITLTNDSDFNYVALNTIVSNGYAQGRANGTGIWLNDDSDGNTVFANSASGAPECGIADFLSSNNLISGNQVFGNQQGGIFVWDGQGDPSYNGSAPVNTVITNNYIHNNTYNGGVILRGATNSDVERNVIAGSYNGTYGSSSDGGILVQRSSETQFVANTLLNLQTGVYAYSTTTSMSVYRNRFINVGENYAFTGATVTFDDSVTVGGNYWSSQPAAGDPSTTTPYTNFVYDAAGDRGGGFVDHFPYQDESLGLPYAATITSPSAGAMVAPGSTRAIQWSSTGSSFVDIYYSSSETGTVPIAANLPDCGVYLWTVPSLPAGSDYTIKIVPMNSSRVAMGSTAVSGTFSSPGGGGLVLLSPGEDQTAAPGSSLQVGWASATANTPVNVQLQTNGGSWTTLASSVTADYVDVTLPSTTTTSARIRIVNASTGEGDTQDGYFRIGTTAAVSSVGNLQIGTNTTLSWISPADAVTVDLQFWNGVAWESIATRLPDIGHFNWFVPEMFTHGATVQVIFHNAADAQIGTATSSAFNIQYTLTAGSAVECYRLYNNVTKEHLYSTDANEYTVLGEDGWSQEGAPFDVENGPASISGVSDEPDYRLYNPVTYQHLWTTDRNEYFTLRTSGVWRPEGVAFYVFPSAVTGSTPLYRLSYNGSTLLHLWTTDLNEYDTLPTDGWTQESVVGYVLG